MMPIFPQLVPALFTVAIAFSCGFESLPTSHTTAFSEGDLLLHREIVFSLSHCISLESI